MLITIFPISVLLSLALSATTDVDTATSRNWALDRPPSSPLGRCLYEDGTCDKAREEETLRW